MRSRRLRSRRSWRKGWVVFAEFLPGFLSSWYVLHMLTIPSFFSFFFLPASVNWKLSVRLVVNNKKPARNSDSPNWIRRKMPSARNERDVLWNRLGGAKGRRRRRRRATSQ